MVHRLACIALTASLSCGLVAGTGISSAIAGEAPASSAGYVRNQLNAVAATSRSNAWAVGYSYNGTENTALIEHWNGSRWRIRAAPNPGYRGSALYGVTAISGSSAWAVGSVSRREGYDTLIEHWNGSRWSIQRSPNPALGPDQLTAVAALSRTDAWAVGSTTLGAHTLIEHWNGSSWKVQASPNPGSFDNALNSVVTISRTNVWAVGYTSNGDGTTQTLIEHWNGHKWAVHASPDPSTQSNDLFGVAAAGRSNVWAAGSMVTADTVAALIARWNGRSWKTQSSPTSAYGIVLRSVTAVSGTVAWAAGFTGDRTLAERWNGHQWRIQSTPDPVSGPNSQLAFYGAAATSRSNAWAVGYNQPNVYDPAAKTLIEHWNGAKWSIQRSPNLS